MLPTSAVLLATARSCLAALADAAQSPDCSACYERLLIDLDVLTDDVGPATFAIVGLTETELVQRAEDAMRRLCFFGVDSLGVELLIERLHRCGGPGPRDREVHPVPCLLDPRWA